MVMDGGVALDRRRDEGIRFGHDRRREVGQQPALDHDPPRNGPEVVTVSLRHLRTQYTHESDAPLTSP